MARTDDDTWDITESVGATALGVAMARAAETAARRPLFVDHYAQWFIDAAEAQRMASRRSARRRTEVAELPERDADRLGLRRRQDQALRRLLHRGGLRGHPPGGHPGGGSGRPRLAVAVGRRHASCTRSTSRRCSRSRARRCERTARRPSPATSPSPSTCVRIGLTALRAAVSTPRSRPRGWPRGCCRTCPRPDRTCCSSASNGSARRTAGSPWSPSDRDYFDPEYQQQRRAAMQEMRDAVASAGRQMTDVSDLFFNEPRADVADWLAGHGWEVDSLERPS